MSNKVKLIKGDAVKVTKSAALIKVLEASGWKIDGKNQKK